jgi:hypothetical protein
VLFGWHYLFMRYPVMNVFSCPLSCRLTVVICLCSIPFPVLLLMSCSCLPRPVLCCSHSPC